MKTVFHYVGVRFDMHGSEYKCMDSLIPICKFVLNVLSISLINYLKKRKSISLIYQSSINCHQP